MNQQMPDANSFLMGGAKSASFKNLGAQVAGVIVSEPQTTQVRDPKSGKPVFWNDDPNQPKLQLVVTLRTQDADINDPQDTGERRLFVKNNMRKAIAAAVRNAGATGLAVGGVLSVKYVRDGISSSAALDPPKEFEAKYIPPQAKQVAVEDAAPPAKDPGAGDPWASPATPDQLSADEDAALKRLMEESN